jgi:preprotein translocase subunit SecE
MRERMNSKVEQPRGAAPGGDAVKHAVALLCVIGGLFAFYWFQQWPTAVRILAVVAGLVAGAAVFLTSFKGAQTREFLSEARFELRKVVWPTRQEAMRTTWVVIIAVILIALLLGVFDWFIKLGISALLGT